MDRIDKHSRIPLYAQLIDIIYEMLDKNELTEGDKLPSERELCEIYQISRATVRQTMMELEKEGIIYKQHGKGAFIAPKKLKQDLSSFYSFSDEMRKIGRKPSSDILSFQTVGSTYKTASKLGIKVNDDVYELKRLRLADDMPIMLETSYIPCDRFPGLKRSDFEGTTMYELFKDRYQAAFTMAEEFLSPTVISEEEAILLKAARNLPGMVIERLTYEGDRVIEYTHSIARGDQYKYHVRLN